MASMTTGVFNESYKATQAIDRLHAAGFAADEISVLTSESTSDHAFAVKTGSKVEAKARRSAGGIGARCLPSSRD